MPHPPQFCESLVVFTQAYRSPANVPTVHCVRPVPQAVAKVTQAPPLHFGLVAPQAVLHAPHARGSLLRSTQVLAKPMVQDVRPGRHVQAPLPLQYILAAVPPPPPQVVPQVPQLIGSSLRSRQRPGVPKQRVMVPGPVGQTHVEAVHDPNCAHTVPQEPQLLRSLVRSAHEPLHMVAGGVHEHAPPVQVPPVPQLVPQEPQLAASVLVSVHLPPQTVGVELGHVQTPLVQLAPEAHTVLQEPQCNGSEDVSMHPTPGQSTLPVPQTHAVTPPTVLQVEPGPQVTPHAPQFFESVLVSTHAPPHSVGAVPGQVHAPLTQVAPVAHFVVQVPHAVTSLERSLHVAPQLTLPVGQTHAPAVQVAVEGHALPQVPQLAPSVFRSTHVVPHTSGLAVGHALQTPLVQVAPLRHAFPQVPQFAASLERSTHLPLHRTLPVGQAHTPNVHT